jgi:hypothetical protein
LANPLLKIYARENRFDLWSLAFWVVPVRATEEGCEKLAKYAFDLVGV